MPRTEQAGYYASQAGANAMDGGLYMPAAMTQAAPVSERTGIAGPHGIGGDEM